MQGFIPPDPETDVSQEHWAVIYMPGRNRQRYPANCVRLVESEEEARVPGPTRTAPFSRQSAWPLEVF